MFTNHDQLEVVMVKQHESLEVVKPLIIVTLVCNIMFVNVANHVTYTSAGICPRDGREKI